MKRIYLAVAALGLWVSAANAQTYTVDTAHSNVGFTIRHLVSKVTGHFDVYSATFDYDGKDLKSFQTVATIQTASINTGNEKRDGHLKSPDFFDAEKFPTLTFKSTKVTDVNGDKAKLLGELTMHGVTKSVILDLEFGGTAKDPWGNTRAGASATTRVNRKDFGIVWNKTLEAGGMMLGDDVDIVINVEGVAKK